MHCGRRAERVQFNGDATTFTRRRLWGSGQLCAQGGKRGAGIIHSKAVRVGHKGSGVMVAVPPWGAGLGCPRGSCPATETHGLGLLLRHGESNSRTGRGAGMGSWN